MTALEKIRKEAKRLQKEHPKMTYRDSLVKAGAAYRAGKIGAKKNLIVKKSIPVKKKSVTRTERVTVIGGVNTTLSKGKKIIAEIHKMEAQLKKMKGREEKNFLKRLINAKHDELDRLAKK